MFYYVFFEDASGARIKREITKDEYESRTAITRFDAERVWRWGADAPAAEYRVIGASAGTTTMAGDKTVGR